MSGTFRDLFTYAGADDPASQFFYSQISGNTNSVQCHTTLLTLFMNALKLSSTKYRTGVFPSPSPVAAIPDENTLNIILNYIPQELLDPVAQVMFEQWNGKINTIAIGNNSYYIETYTNATSAASVPQTLQDAVDYVRASYFTQMFNDLQTEYNSKGWIVSQIPASMPNLSTQNPPTKANVIAQIQLLKDWINTNDPKISAITTLRGQANVATILNSLFGGAPTANISTADFCEKLCNQILYSNTLAVAGQKGAVRLFLETVWNALNTDGSIWQTNATLQSLVQQFVGSQVESHWRLQTSWAFKLINQLFQTALTLSDATALNNAKIAIGQIFTTLNGATTSQVNYLYTTILTTCDNLAQTANYDPFVLDGWVVELNEVIPQTINYGYIEALMKETCNVIQSIPLTFDSNNVRIFPFSNFDDLKAKPNASGFNRGSTEYNSDNYNVYADAIEYSVNPHSPIPVANNSIWRPVYGIFLDGNPNTFLKFFNVGAAAGLPVGVFHFTDATSATLVRTVNFSNSAVLNFDFNALNINNSNQVPDAGISGVILDGSTVTMLGGTQYKLQNGRSVSRVNFLNAVRLLSKWKTLDGQRQYEVMYTTVPPSTTLCNAHLIWYVASGNLDRTDKVDNSLYVWEWMASDSIKGQYPQLPNLLGLAANRELNNSGAGIRFRTLLLPLQNNINTVAVFLSETGDFLNPDSVYFQINTPSLNLPFTINQVLNKNGPNASTALNPNSINIMDIFNFRYFRRSDTRFSKIIKNLPAKNRPSSTDDGINLSDPTQPPSEIGINIPIATRIPANVLYFKQYTGAAGPANISLKNKGNALYKTKGKRLQAGSVMSALRNNMAAGLTPPALPGTASSLPATDFANWVLTKSNDFVLPKWRNLKMTNRGTLPTDQEWCHLLGHGDGGDERLGNFVSGSFHCNTEQLAMESKERRAITQAAVKGTYELRATAYLFNDNKVLLGSNYLNNDSAYKKMTAVYNANRQAAVKTVKPSGAGTVMPLSAFIRYKMYSYTNNPDVAGSKIENKLFDHVFEGQSEFMDEHQFNILKYVSYFAVASTDKFIQWYNEQSRAMQDDAASM